MRPGQDLTDVTTAFLQGLKAVLSSFKPDIVLVLGDTTTTFSTTLAAYYHQIPVAHVEAGLRTGNLYSPWPEEANRKLTAALAEVHFAPTDTSRQNLLREGVPPDHIIVTGNTVIDALLDVSRRLDTDPGLRAEAASPTSSLTASGRVILVTGHRRESFGGGFERICQALVKIARDHPDVSNKRYRKPYDDSANIKLTDMKPTFLDNIIERLTARSTSQHYEVLFFAPAHFLFFNFLAYAQNTLSFFCHAQTQHRKK